MQRAAEMIAQGMRPPVYFLATYWGQGFQDMLCRFALSSLLAPGNIPALGERDRARFLLATPLEDWQRIQEDPWFKALARWIRFEHLRNEEAYPGEHKYIRMSRGHALLAERCFSDGAVAVNINPDSIYPDNSVAEAERLWAEGARIILCVAVRFDQDGIEAELNRTGALQPGLPLIVPNTQAVELGLRHLHSETRASRWGAPHFGALADVHRREHFLTCCYWPIPDNEGVVIVTHNWAPFLVDYTLLSHHDTSALDGRALDGNYIFENFVDAALDRDIHVVTDSSSLFMLGMTPRDEMEPPCAPYWWKVLPVLRYMTGGYILNQTIFDPGVDAMRRRIYREKLVLWHLKGRTANALRTLAKAQTVLDRFGCTDLSAKRFLSGPRPLVGLLRAVSGWAGLLIILFQGAIMLPSGLVGRLSNRLLTSPAVWNFVTRWGEKVEAVQRAVRTAIVGRF